ncbi:SRPBCC domain-containing protein [Brevibacterium litoralis]|uniref:SRPBCC domain-containing protein n=1 Tax=Brevibacterium litoralis TaxID=3138935 RepID=UPI0032EC0174
MERFVEESGTRAVVRTTWRLAAPRARVWAALTDPQQLADWFDTVDTVPAAVGDRYRLADSATEGGIRTCEQGHHLGFSWEYGEDVSEVELHLEEDTPPEAPSTAGADGSSAAGTGGEGAGEQGASGAEVPGCRLSLTHVMDANEHWVRYGPGATGLGWDGALLALSMYLRGEDGCDPASMTAFFASPMGHLWIEEAASGWEAAHVAAGAEDSAARACAHRTMTAYTGSAA